MPKFPASPEDMDARMRLGALLAQIREGAELSQAELARRCGKQQMWCSRIENGVTGVEPHEVVAWCRACGTHAEMVIGDEARSPEAIFLARQPPRVRQLLVQVSRAIEHGGEWSFARFEKEVEVQQERAVASSLARAKDERAG